MRRQRLTLLPQQRPDLERQVIALTEPQMHYLRHVLRLRDGDKFWLLDGVGSWYETQLQGTLAQVGEPTLAPSQELGIELHLAIAMPKGTAMESVVRHATELGVHHIHPLWSDRTVNRHDLGRQKLQRWQRIASEAAELSLRSHCPPVSAPQDYSQWLANWADTFGQKLIAVTDRGAPHLLNLWASNCDRPMALLTGCEGGWTARETQAAQDYGFRPCSLGDRTLSAVTAPLAGLSLLAALWESQQ
ncbi:MAG: 16S rRNA (uracil(1498)-N(3))-methyltransferase [Oscillatoriales cyanobacterium SM2_2_1]|nr:16S rRNA (uracil(1498)-N(3))-methyltransferase [Oscillatoriales cyanobacterium SM2_2_1]